MHVEQQRSAQRGAPEPIEQALAGYVAALQAASLPPAALDAFDRLIFDFVSVVLAGASDAEARRAAGALTDAYGAGGSSLIGRSGRVPAPAAAFAHGVLAHWFDWDDTHDASHVHGGAVIFSALIALSETLPRRAMPPVEFVTACVAAYDVACRVGGFLKAHGPRGWMPTGSGATIGAAAAGGRLAGLDTQGIVSAMGIAAANAGLSRQALADRANSKGILAGIAAKTAVEAVLLARAGVQGAPGFLTGSYGLQTLHGAAGEDASSVLAELGARFSITDVGIKPYPCCRSTHAVIGAVLSLTRDNPHCAAKVELVRAIVPAGVRERCGGPFFVGSDPRLNAQFSIPYTIAIALYKGEPKLSDFSPETVRANAEIYAALIRNVVVDAEAAGGEDLLAPITLQLVAGGQILERRFDRVPGAPDAPLDDEARNAKFADAAGAAHLSAPVRDGLAELAWAARSSGITPLTQCLRDLHLE